MNRLTCLSVGVLALWAVSSTVATPSKNVKPKSANVTATSSEVIPVTTTTQITQIISEPNSFTVVVEEKTVQEKTILKVADKPNLGDAFIFQNTLQVLLNRPMSISLYNAQGQLVYHQESQRKAETIPLQGTQAGFLYLTLRSGNLELTKKLLYTGR